MDRIASDTFLWISREAEEQRGEPGETVGFAKILEISEATTRTQQDAEQVGRETLLVRDMDACDGILADERLESPEWINWSDAKRELQRKD